MYYKKRICLSVGLFKVVLDPEGSRPIYIKYVEGLGSLKATPNLDVESRWPNHTTTVLPNRVTPIYSKNYYKEENYPIVKTIYLNT